MQWIARFVAWLARKLYPNGATWVFLAGLVLMVSSSLNRAAWVPDSSPLAWAWVYGLLVGIALAKSRFRGLPAAGYHLALAWLYLLLSIGKVVPPLGQWFARPFLANLELMNVRLLSMLDRSGGWIATLAAGQNIQDNGLFVLLIGLLGWAGAAWLAWSVVRRGQALAGLLPAGIMLGINVNLSQQPVETLWYFLAVGLLLIARTAMAGLHRSWERRGVDYPEDLALNWWGAALGVCLVVLMAARLAPLVGSPEGWKTLSDLFRQAQRQVEDTTNRMFGDVAPPKATQDKYETPVPPRVDAETPQMGVIGSMPAQIDATVLWVRTSDPPPPEPDPGMPEGVLEPGPVHYWRGGVFGGYTGVGWEGLPVTDAPAQPPAGLPERSPLTQEFEIVARHGAALFAASQPVQVSAGEARLRFTAPDGSPMVFGTGSSYTVLSEVTAQPSDIALRAAPSAYPPEIASTFLQLPAGLPQRVRDLARRVVGDAATPYDKAVRIQDYLRLSYPYKLDVPPPPAGRDAADYFLFDAPGGFCSYYATAMAVMLRSQGVAARVASGYATGYYDHSRGAYRVTPYNAHAWVEVYFPGYGWIEFEPTAALARISYETRAGQGQVSSAPLPERPPLPRPAWQTGLLVGLALAAPLALFGLAFVLRARRLREQSWPPARRAERLYLDLRRYLGWAGLSAPPSATPDEFLRASAPGLAGRGALPAALDQATALYRRAVFSQRPPSHAEIEASRRLVQSSWVEWVRLWALNRTGRLYHRDAEAQRKK